MRATPAQSGKPLFEQAVRCKIVQKEVAALLSNARIDAYVALWAQQDAAGRTRPPERSVIIWPTDAPPGVEAGHVRTNAFS